MVEADVIVHVYDAAHDLGIARPLPEKYKGYSSQVPSLFGGPAGRIKRLQDEMK